VLVLFLIVKSNDSKSQFLSTAVKLRIYYCAFLTVDLLFVAEIPRNAATIKYRFLFNQVSVLQNKRQRTQRAEQGSHTGKNAISA
jgi:hypothetical protein